MNQARWIFLITKGILHDRAVRRKMLFWIVLAALGLLGAGATLLESLLAGHPLLFLLYWGAVAWLTFTAALLALYDMLAVRADAARDRRELKRRILGEDSDKPNNP